VFKQARTREDAILKKDCAIVTLPALPFIDLASQRRRLGSRVDEAIANVVNSCQFVMGPPVFEAERQLAAFCGAKHALTCSSGTDALQLYLMAKGVKAGDAVLCPAFTFAATAEVIVLLGATPVFVDVLPDTFNMDPDSLKSGIATARQHKLNPVGVMTVDLFGLPADYDAIEPICAHEGLWLLCDAAQGFGGTYKGRKVGTIGDATATSFFPAKPLGVYGDGGAVTTDNAELNEILKSLRVHGQGADKYDNVRIGLTARMDTIQAAVLIEKLGIFEDEIAARNKAAKVYNEGLAPFCIVPAMPEGLTSVWAQYTVRVKPERRDAIMASLKSEGVPTAIYYPKPIHTQEPYKHAPIAGNGLAVTETIRHEVFSLPMHAYLDEAAQTRVVEAFERAVKAA